MLVAQVTAFLDAPGATKVNMRRLVRQNARYVKLESIILPKVKVRAFCVVRGRTATRLELILVRRALHAKLENGHQQVRLSARHVLQDAIPRSSPQNASCAYQAHMPHFIKILAYPVMQAHTAPMQQVHVLHAREDIFPYRLPRSVSCVKRGRSRLVELLIAPYVPQIPIAARVLAAAHLARKGFLRGSGLRLATLVPACENQRLHPRRNLVSFTHTRMCSRSRSTRGRFINTAQLCARQ